MTRRVAIVTGAGQELGEASALRFFEAGWSVACVDGAGSRRMVDDAVQTFGRLDALHLNAPQRRAPAAGEPALADWDRLHAEALRAAYLGIRDAIPALRAAGGGAIVLTAGAAGAAIDPAQATMNGALRSLCRSVATGYGRDGIRINTISPGRIATADPEDVEEFAARLPLGRLASPRDLANVALFLASPEASYVTGTDIVMDGGCLALVS